MDRRRWIESFHLEDLMRRSAGDPSIKIGIVDGPVVSGHADLQHARLRTLTSRAAGCELSDSLACQHGTFIAGILAASRNSSAPGLCPNCTFISRPVFCEPGIAGRVCPAVTPEHLAAAIVDVLNAGAHVINLSVGLGTSALQPHPALDEALEHAQERGSLVIAAAGNHGRVGHVPLFRHTWVIPVAASDLEGKPLPGTNLGADIGRRGLLAPGQNVTSISSAGGYMQLTGTSVAAPFVTGTVALLWSLFPRTPVGTIRSAILRTRIRRSSITPPRLDGLASLEALSH